MKRSREIIPVDAVPVLDVPRTPLVQGYVERAHAPRTVRAYERSLAPFVAWCEQHEYSALPADPEHVAEYLAELASSGRKVATIELALTAISQAHRLAGLETPRAAYVVRAALEGIRRVHGSAPSQRSPILLDELESMVLALAPSPPTTLRQIRDVALILFGWHSALRRSAIVSLNVQDLERSDALGYVVHVRRDKTDQRGAGRSIRVPFGNHRLCAVHALDVWSMVRKRVPGLPLEPEPLFRGISPNGELLGRLSDRGVARIVQHAAKLAGLDPSRYAGHSLRAGFATSAAIAGKPEWLIAEKTGHKSRQTLAGYIRAAGLHRDDAAIGLTEKK